MPAGRQDVKARFPQVSNPVVFVSSAIPSPSPAKPISSLGGITNPAPATLATTAAGSRVSTSRIESNANPSSSAIPLSNANQLSSAQPGSSINSLSSAKPESGTKSDSSAKLDLSTKLDSSARPESSRKPESGKKSESTQTPTFFPTASYLPVQVVPATELPPPVTYSSIPKYEGSNAVILRGYCTEPGYTILDGPTVLWVPVVGCISSKAQCCPTPSGEGGGNATPTPDQQNAPQSVPPSAGAGQAGKAAFPVSSLPSQGSLTGCPQDYHTVTGTGGVACCPSSYWLWSTQLGGQVPCYSSLRQALVPPPIPDTLINLGRMTATGSLTAEPSSRPALETQKPTSAVANIAYAMQYKLAAEPDQESKGLKKEAKIGVGAGVAGVSLLIAAVLGFFLWRRLKQKKNKNGLEFPSASERFNSQVDMSQIAHEQPGMARTHGGVKYAGVSTRPVDY